jgi:transcription elongation factor GreA
MSKKISYYTKEGLEKLTSDLSRLKSKGRADIARQIAEARDKGDLSENAEYDAAKDAGSSRSKNRSTGRPGL